MTAAPALPTFGEIVAALNARPLEVAQHYAPGGYVDGRNYWALNPGRADKSIGSFTVAIGGHYAGHWKDYATGEQGDMLDLIQLALGCDRRQALDEARTFLGLWHETEEQRALRRRRDEQLAQERRQKERQAEEERARSRRAAHALWLQCHERLYGTPVAEYLAARHVGLDRLGRVPHAIRFHPDLPYRHVDKETGEIVEGRWPAMVTAIHGPANGGRPEFWGAHRTWLAPGAGGRMGKAPVPQAKKVMGQKQGGFIRLWSGFGPRGGKGQPLSLAAEGTHCVITEGIEDGLSAAVIWPEARVLCAVDLGNLSAIILPSVVTAVTICADNDPDPKCQAALERAVVRMKGEGRAVKVWRNQWGGKDVNDALVAADEAEGWAGGRVTAEAAQ